MITKVYGPPGTGKTSWLLDTLDRELSTTPPTRVAFLSFTRKARAEAQHRAGLRWPGVELPYVRTLHSVCYAELGLRRGDLVDGFALREFGELTGLSFGDADADFSLDYPVIFRDNTGAELLAESHLMRARKMKLTEAYSWYTGSVPLNIYEWFIEAYEDWKKRRLLLDFTDLLIRFVARGKPLPVDVLIVDEAQDLSPLQWDVVHVMAGSAARVYLAGDDDQAIYEWAGASAQAFVATPADNWVTLPMSYRLPTEIAAFVQKLGQRISHRQPKSWTGAREGGEIIVTALPFDQLDPRVDTLVLYRSHYVASAIERQLVLTGTPFDGRRSPLRHRHVIRAIETWLSLQRGETASWAEIHNLTTMMPTRLLPAGLAERSRSLARTDEQAQDHELPLELAWPLALTAAPSVHHLEQIVAQHGLTGLYMPKIKLTTIHGAKGGEADRVIVLPDVSARTLNAYREDPDQEHRVFYVAASRARRELVIATPVTTSFYDFPLEA